MNYFRVLCFCVFMFFVGCRENIARKPINKIINLKKNESVNLAKKIYAKEIQNIKKFIRQNKEVNFKFHDRGFWYVIEKKGNSLKFKQGDSLEITYNLLSLNKDVLYSNLNKKVLVGKDFEIRGFSEALKMLRVGAKASFIFPSYQVYGYSGNNKNILPNMTILCEVKVLNIIN